ncbi:MAG: hypothetical protein NZ522_02595, partial [Chitinophagales bacterium]|nr:hypothetical protein [Chitinophagales bacterium]
CGRDPERSEGRGRRGHPQNIIIQNNSFSAPEAQYLFDSTHDSEFMIYCVTLCKDNVDDSGKLFTARVEHVWH